MATHFQWYPSSEETVVPFNARYSFPSQANKAVKVTPRLPPVSGTSFTPGQTIKVTFPAQGYMNPRNTTFVFDVTMSTTGNAASATTGMLLRFQNNIQSIFQKVRLLYGATPLEDISNYNVLVRQLTEWTGTNGIDGTSINEGIGGVYDTAVTATGVAKPGALGPAGAKTFSPTATWNRESGYEAGSQIFYIANKGIGNVRQDMIQGVDCSWGSGANFKPNNLQAVGTSTTGNDAASSNVAAFTTTRRYQIQLALGLFTQEKLIPLKWMASQLSIELTLAPEASCMFLKTPGDTGSNQTYSISNFAAIPELLEFDASYDAMFLKGLREGGVPIKFSSWHTYTYPVGAQNLVNFIIPEKSRSVKSIFTIQRRGTDIIGSDSGAAFFSSVASSALQTYQYRIGGRYFPASPVQCSTTISSSTSNGGAEAYIEHQKALNQLGDYRLSTPLDSLRWAVPYTVLNTESVLSIPQNPNSIALNEADFSGGYVRKNDGTLTIQNTSLNGCSRIGSTQFSASIDLETSSGVEIAGLNAEEQSDIAFVAQYSANQAANYNLEAYVYYDAMLVLRENNVLELIQ